MIETDYTSPKAKIISDGQINSIACPRAGQEVCFVRLPSCRAGTYFYCAVKVGKSASKEGRKPFGAVSLPPLKPTYLSTDREPPPRGKRAVSYVFESVR